MPLHPLLLLAPALATSTAVPVQVSSLSGETVDVEAVTAGEALDKALTELTGAPRVYGARLLDGDNALPDGAPLLQGMHLTLTVPPPPPLELRKIYKIAGPTVVVTAPAVMDTTRPRPVCSEQSSEHACRGVVVGDRPNENQYTADEHNDMKCVVPVYWYSATGNHDLYRPASNATDMEVHCQLRRMPPKRAMEDNEIRQFVTDVANRQLTPAYIYLWEVDDENDPATPHRMSPGEANYTLESMEEWLRHWTTNMP